MVDRDRLRIRIGRRLEKARRIRGLTMRKAAKLLEVSVACLHYWEQGTRAPKLDDAAAICDRYRITVSSLVDGLEEARVMSAEEIPPDGYGWIESWYEGDEEGPDEKVLRRAAWAGWQSVMVEEDGRFSGYGSVDPGSVLGEKYNVPYGWRLWTMKPTGKQREEAAWDGQG